MILSLFAEAGSAIRFDQLGLSPIALDLGFFKLRWYSLAYIASILFGWWYLLKLIAQPGAPMARRHADDFVFYATLGIIVGGRLGYCLFYKPEIFLTPLDVFKLWEGGMSLHGGTLGTLIAIGWFTYRNKLSFIRFCDYIACATPFGLFFVRLANFVNGELWGRPTDVAWAMIFPATQDEIARHPSQLYEAGLEGLLSFAVLWLLFWKSDARYYPGRLFGMLALLYGSVRFGLEFLREPDEGVTGLLGLTMGQTLCIPMVLLGAYMIATSKARRERVESAAGTASIA